MATPPQEEEATLNIALEASEVRMRILLMHLDRDKSWIIEGSTTKSARYGLEIQEDVSLRLLMCVLVQPSQGLVVRDERASRRKDKECKMIVDKARIDENAVMVMVAVTLVDSYSSTPIDEETSQGSQYISIPHGQQGSC